MVQIMTVTELEGLLKEGPEAAQFIDVREKQEHDIASLPHFQLLPLSRSVHHQSPVPSPILHDPKLVRKSAYRLRTTSALLTWAIIRIE